MHFKFNGCCVSHKTFQIAQKATVQTTEPALILQLVLFVTVQMDLQVSIVKYVSKRTIVQLVSII